MTEDSEASVPTARRAPQHVRLFPVDDAYEHLCILTLLPSLGPLHLMLADALSPHGSNATLASVGTLSEGFERFVTSPLYLVGYVRWDARSDQSSFVKRSLQQLSGRNPTTRLRASVSSLLRVGRYTAKWRRNAVARCWPTPEEHMPSGLDRVRVGLISTVITSELSRNPALRS